MSAQKTRFRAIALTAGGVLLAIVALALHPHLSGHAGPPAELRELGRLSMRDRLVHGTLLLLLAALLVQMTNFALRRGLEKMPVVAGLVGFCIGIGALLAAGLIDGFILPQIVAQFAGSAPAVQAAAVTTLAACGAAVNVFAAFGVAALAVAIAAWSVDLALDAGHRIVAVIGAVAAALTLAVLATGGAALTPHALIAMLSTQGVWYVALAVLPRPNERKG